MIPKLKEYKERWMIKSDDSIKPGLEAIEKALGQLGNPEKKLKVIHVAGTNGKGSTIAFMESILKEHGYKTGVFSSPAIIDIHDQLRIDGDSISQNELNKTFKEMNDAGVSGMLTDFELLTVAAFVTFGRLRLDYVLLETGMGGLLDSTNVVNPVISVITSIALDHISFLGSTVEQVAAHKAGIIKAGIPIITGPLPQGALEVVRRVAKEKGSALLIYGDHFEMENGQHGLFKGECEFILSGRKMKGDHQGMNAAVAIEALLVAGLSLTEVGVAKAIAETQLGYRFQEVATGVFLDGAHNPAAARALANTIRSEFPNEKVDFVVGMLKGKEIKKTLDELIPVAESFTFLTFPHSEAATGEQLIENCHHNKKRVTKTESDTIILDMGSKKIIVTGSLYLLSGLKYL